MQQQSIVLVAEASNEKGHREYYSTQRKRHTEAQLQKWQDG